MRALTRGLVQVLVAGQIVAGIPTRAAAAEPTPVIPAATATPPVVAQAALAIPPAPAPPLPAPAAPKANTTAPSVAVRGSLPSFSDVPTEEEFFSAHAFDEPLVPIGGVESVGDDVAFARALTMYAETADIEGFAPLEAYLAVHPHSRWRASLLTGLALTYRKTGYFSRALAAAEEAWSLAKADTSLKGSRLADRALAQLAELSARLGRYERLDQMFEEVRLRDIGGSAGEWMQRARLGRATMDEDPGRSFRCGPFALESVYQAKFRAQRASETLAAAMSTNRGTSLAQLQKWSDEAGLGLRMARWNGEAEIPLPAVIHLRSGHFAAVLAEEDGRYRVNDPTFAGEYWMSGPALRDETSGHFMIDKAVAVAGWSSVGEQEAGDVWGKGYIDALEPEPPEQPETNQCPANPPPMATYSIKLFNVGLHVYDAPVGYQPATGPAVRFQVDYSQRTTAQPGSFDYSNLGPKWTFNWLSYVSDTSSLTGPVKLYARGGGESSYTGMGSSDHVSDPQSRDQSVLTRTSLASNPPVYERTLTDGSREIFGGTNAVLGMTDRKILLTQVIDAQGQAIAFQYDSMARLTSVTDATGLVSTLTYDVGQRAIRKVTDPFGRSAAFDYDPSGRLARVTDPAGIVSEFSYGAADFIGSMTTPYGTTRFTTGGPDYPYGSGQPVRQHVEAEDPLGAKERVEMIQTISIGEEDKPVGMPVAPHNGLLTARNTFHFDKRSYAFYPSDYLKAHVYHWLHGGAGLPAATGVAVLESEKPPLESRIWHNYVGQEFLSGFPAPPSTTYSGSGLRTATARKLQDGSTQMTKWEYNARGRVIKATDPVGRETVYVYGTGSTPDCSEPGSPPGCTPATGHGLDLLQVKQKNPGGSGVGGYDVLGSTTYNAGRQPLTTTDAAGQTTTYTYLVDGRIATMVTPARNGPTGVPLTVEERTTTYSYYADTASPEIRRRLYRVTGPSTPAGAPTTTYTYDPYGRLRTTTDEEGYTLTYDYDVLDRLVKTTYPDATFEETVYDRLEASRTMDRLGHWTERRHDALRRMVSTRDAEGRTTTYDWCTCGSLDSLIDANGNRTAWERDVQGRVTRELRADNAAWEYTYDLSGRLSTRKDPRNQVTTYTYTTDGNMAGTTYTSAVVTTPNVSYTYDPWFRRLTQLADGSGTSFYGYHPITPSPGFTAGAGQLSSLNGPLGSDTLTYEYDELGRVRLRQLNGVLNEVSYKYDALSRMVSQFNMMGNFTFAYQGVTGRLATVTYPNGQTSTYTYDGNAGDHRLQDIHHRSPTAVTLSRHTYTTSAVGQISTWTQQVGTSTPEVYELAYDDVDQLSGAVRKSVGIPSTVLKTYGWSYDAAGNRTQEAIDAAVVSATYDNRNRLLTQQAGGSLRFSGSLNEPAAVTVGGQPAEVSGENRFAGSAGVVTGSQSVQVTATDPSGRSRTNVYSVSVTGSGGTFMHDENGNLTSDGVRTFEWDAENRLYRVVVSGSEVARFVYDARSQRRQKIVGGATRAYILDGNHAIEERLSGTLSGTVRYFHGAGTDDWLGRVGATGAPTYFVADHLGSIVRQTDVAGVPTLTRLYDLWGRLDATSAAIGGPAYTGREWDPETALSYYRARYYDGALGRFLSDDPIRTRGGLNFQRYVENDPVNFSDPSGLILWKCFRKSNGFLSGFNHAYFCDPATGNSCGKGKQGGKSRPRQFEECPGRHCVPVPGSAGKVKDLMDCCLFELRDDPNHNGFWPFVDDCHTYLSSCLTRWGVADPKDPWGRSGCLSCQGAGSGGW
jgi:RHS repeat-associated protein